MQCGEVGRSQPARMHVTRGLARTPGLRDGLRGNEMEKTICRVALLGILASIACSSSSETGTTTRDGSVPSTGGALGTGGSSGGGGQSAGGSSGTGGVSRGGAANAGGSSAGGASSSGGASGTGGSPVVPTSCTMGGGECPAGWQCLCQSPNNPSFDPACACAKECQSAADCQAPNNLCGCSTNGPAQGLCVSNCFCVCG